VRFWSEQHTLRLAVGGRLRKQVLDVVQWQAAVNELDRDSLRHAVATLRLVGKDWKRFEVPRLASILQPPRANLPLLQPLALAARAPNCKDHDLFVLNAFGFTQPVHFGILELNREDIPANCNLRDGDNQNENAARLEPPVGMLEEESFKSVAGAIAVGGGVVGRVEERS
jgi:hypothetical protein